MTCLLAVFTDVAAKRRRVLVRMNCVRAVIGHRTSEGAQRPGREREHSDRATESTVGLNIKCTQAGHAGIIRGPTGRVKVAPRTPS